MSGRGSRLGIIIIGLLASLYIVSGWMTPKTWDLDVLDGSWEYALSIGSRQGEFVGKDFFFNYGPLDQRLAPLIEDGEKPSPFYYAIGTVYLALFLFALSQLIAIIPVFTWKHGLLVAGLCVSFAGLGFSADHGSLDCSFYFLTILLCMSACAQDDLNKRKLLFYALLVVATAGVLIKFSIGFHACMIALLVAWSFHSTTSFKEVVLSLCICVLAGYVLFFLLTGSWSFHDYLYGGFYYSSLYSENCGIHKPWGTSDWRYAFGLAGCLSFPLVAILAGRSDPFKRDCRVALIGTAVISAFFLFKAGFVRADQHTLMVYRTLLPVLILFCAIGMRSIGRSWLSVAAVAAGFAIFIAGYQYELKLFGSSLPREVAEELRGWRDAPIRIVNGIVMLRDGYADQRSRLSAVLRAAPNLFLYLSKLDNTQKGTASRITFVPWELMFHSMTPNLRLSIPPALQIYAEATTWQAPELVDRYFRAETRPDLIVIGNGAIDGRNSVAEFTNWLGFLYRDYRPIASLDGYTVLRHSGSPNPDREFECDGTGPGLFLKARIGSSSVVHGLAHKLVAMLYKAPELEIVIDYEDALGNTRSLICRGLRSQLQQGTYLCDVPVGKLLEEMNNRSLVDGTRVITRVRSAKLVRSPGLRNLPVVPEEVPIDVEFCRPRGFQWL
ncbi:MAG: hypothetical protein HY914_14640 [Desulfomonile tiedjei]|nr:hypothetical protein [Desulfomonile tiedjei]